LKRRRRRIRWYGCAVSSAVEHFLHTEGVAGSNPAPRTIIPNEIEDLGASDTALTQETAETEGANVKYPKRIKYRGRVLATIYGKCKGRDSYRVAWQVAGQRRMASFPSYSLAKRHADGLVKELAKGSQVTALNPAQARDALAALERLTDYFRATGRRVSLLATASEFVEASAKLNGRTLGEAVEGYLRTVATVKRKDIAAAVEEFIQINEPRTRAVNGQRAQLSGKYFYNLSIQLRRFAATFPNTALCDLTKQHLDTFTASLGDLSAKSRNHHRAAVRQFLQWAVRKDYLSVTHRLGEADGLRPEHANTAEISLYTPRELAALLANADDSLRPLVAIGGLAGLRTAELLRLDWADVWRVPGHIEVTAGKAKTRQRRLVEICPALQAWLEPYRVRERGKFWPGGETTFQDQFGELCKTAEVPRKANGLRHSFCTYHFAAHANENQTAQQAGNSPAQIHAHYKGLATKADAKKWFIVRPARTAKNIVPLAAVSRKQAH
jgi:integrase